MAYRPMYWRHLMPGLALACGLLTAVPSQAAQDLNALYLTWNFSYTIPPAVPGDVTVHASGVITTTDQLIAQTPIPPDPGFPNPTPFPEIFGYPIVSITGQRNGVPILGPIPTNGPGVETQLRHGDLNSVVWDNLLLPPGQPLFDYGGMYYATTDYNSDRPFAGGDWNVYWFQDTSDPNDPGHYYELNILQTDPGDPTGNPNLQSAVWGVLTDFSLTPAPEPMSILLLLGAGVVLGVTRYGRAYAVQAARPSR